MAVNTQVAYQFNPAYRLYPRKAEKRSSTLFFRYKDVAQRRYLKN